MPTVTGMIGDRVYTLTLDGSTVQGDEAMVTSFEGCADEAACLAHARQLFGDTMRVSEGTPAPVQFPFMADSPVKPGDVTQPQATTGTPRVVDETQLAAPAAPGSAPMGASTGQATTAPEDTHPEEQTSRRSERR